MIKLIKFAPYSLLLFIPAAYSNSNWLLGVSGGLLKQKTSLEYIIDYGPDFADQFSESTLNFKENGSFYGVLGGYQLFCDNWILGAELNVNWNTLDDQNTNLVFSSDTPDVYWAIHSQLKNEMTVAFTARIAYAFADYFIPYIRLGLESNHYHIDSSGVYNPSISVSSYFPTDLNAEKWLFNFIGGIGLEIPAFINCITFRLEYDFHSRPNSIITDSYGALDNLPVFFSTELKPKIQSVQASIVWNFG